MGSSGSELVLMAGCCEDINVRSSSRMFWKLTL